MDDIRHMKRAISLAARARGRTSPNPAVGAVLVKSGRVLAEDYHRRAGTPHAEALVLQRAGPGARGGTLYVSLEPCCHTAKRTPPCTEAIMGAGVKRVVVAHEDPNPRVSGRGIRRLLEAGIKVETGVMEAEARSLNEPYIKYITTGRPLVILKTAMTLDGKIATPTGQSKWITGPEARRLVHRVRGRVDALLSGVGTVAADDPEFTSRVRGGRNPVRVIIDPDLRTPDGARVLKCPPETILVTRSADPARLRALQGMGVGVLRYEGALSLDWLMKELAGRGMTSVLIEAGSTLNAHAMAEQVVDKVMFFIAPKIIGGKASPGPIGGETFRSLQDACIVRDMRVRRLGEDLLVEGRVKYPPVENRSSGTGGP